MHRIKFNRISESRILAADKSGKIWEVLVIKEGLSRNLCPEGFRYYYDAAMLKTALPLFDNRPAYAFEFSSEYFNHVPDGAIPIKQQAGIAKNKVGVYTNPHWGQDDEGNEGIICTLTLVDVDLAGKMREAWDSGLRDFVGYSIDGDGGYELVKVGGQTVASVQLRSIDSIDVVTSPAAGGKNIRLVAAQSSDQTEDKKPMNVKVRSAIFRILEARKAAKERSDRILEADDASALTVAVEELKKEADVMQRQSGMEQAVQLAQEAISALQAGNADGALVALQKLLDLQAPPAPAPAAQNSAAPAAQSGQPSPTVVNPTAPAQAADNKPQEPAGANGGSAGTPDQMQQLKEEVASLKTELDQDKAIKLIEASNLPDASKEHLKESVRERSLTSQRVREAIQAEQKYLERLGIGNTENVQLREAGREDVILAVEGFFDNADQKDPKGRVVRRFRNIREAAMRGFGVSHDVAQNADRLLGMLCRNSYASSVRLAESMTTATFDQVFGDALHRKLMKEYQLPLWNDWQNIVEIVDDITDFREHNFIRLGYWGELPDVNPDGGTFQDLPDLADEQVGLSVTTKGGIFSITRKMLVNDDMRAIRLLPVRAGRALKMRIYRAVFGALVNNVACGYDNTALLHTNHANKAGGSDTLSAPALNAGRSKMFMQKAALSDATEPEYLGEANTPRWLIVHPDNEQMALALTKSVAAVQLAQAAGGYAASQFLASNTVPNLHQNTMDYILCPRIPNATYWWMLADPSYVPTIAVGFLNGQREPELFQEVANSGSNFTADKVSYKVRHDAGVKPVDHRGVYGFNG
ncbi:hypothetical protein KKH18_06980 [bacterium]|nr:hypothetical protein [bacterium]